MPTPKENPTFMLLERLTTYSKTLAALPDTEEAKPLRKQVQSAMTSVLLQLGDVEVLGENKFAAVGLAMNTLLSLFPRARFKPVESVTVVQPSVEEIGLRANLVLSLGGFGGQVTVTIAGIPLKPVRVDVHCPHCNTNWWKRSKEEVTECPRCHRTEGLLLSVPSDRMEDP